MKNLFYIVIITIIVFTKTYYSVQIAYRYSASIRVDSKAKCVGAVLSQKYILTLCDCVKDVLKTPSVVTVRVGILSKDSRIVEAKNITCHHKFINDIKTPDMNLAVIKTETFQIKPSGSIERAGIPDLRPKKGISNPPLKPRIKQSITMVGWMYDKYYYTLKTDPGMRTWMGLGVVASAIKCMEPQYMARRFEYTMFCAEFYHRGTDNCSADLGTLMVHSGMVWGLMSYKKAKCGSFLNFVPYVDVSSHIDFLKEVCV